MHSKPTSYEQVQCQVVAGKYEGEMAKSVLAHHANYQIVQQGKSNGRMWVIAMFRRPINGPTPAHLTVVTDPFKIAKFEQWRQQSNA
jgi:hypothetical protein